MTWICENLDIDDLHAPEVHIFNKIYLFGTLGAYMLKFEATRKKK